EIEKQHPEWIRLDSPTLSVNEGLSPGFKTVAHKTPMLSLANTYSKDEIVDFIKRVEKITGKEALSFSCELKMDGIAVSVCYEKGFFKRGVTRGDGKKGDDITANIRMIKSLPLHLQGDPIPDLLEARGEVFMPLTAFYEINQKREEAGEVLFANARNASAGSLKLLDSKEAAKRKLSIVFYGIAEESTVSINSQHGIQHYLEKLGLPVLAESAKCDNLEEIWDFIEKVRQLRKTLSFEIDGVVIKVDDIKEQRRMGNTGKNPRYAIAYKFAAEQAFTKIVAISVQVGRTGILTPVAELEPVFVSGSTISRATLHNQDEIDRKDIRIGDRVCIEKGGDVIPKVVSVDLQFRDKDSSPWVMPKQCPSCASLVVKEAGEVAFRCPNSEECPAQNFKNLVHFVGKTAFDIEDMGEKVVEQLKEKGFIENPSDIFTLTEEKLYQLEGFKEKSVKKLLAGIERAKNISLAKFIMALSIKHVGAQTAELLAKKAGSIENVLKLNFEELLAIEGVGDKVALSIVHYFKDEKNKQEIEKLLKYGVKPVEVETISFAGHPFADKTFVLTGNLSRYTRDKASSLIKMRGGKVSSSVSKKTDFILVGEEAGSKLDKAKELKIELLDEDAFEKLL
ncbi:MAG TPA: NAD-dependent DNA ligase LigA, partial [Parachlamydiaceae bacterium]|nr:NAD-dependent DNA ligase LigA [Parachlamydiaceae bacterium]